MGPRKKWRKNFSTIFYRYQINLRCHESAIVSWTVQLRDAAIAMTASPICDDSGIRVPTRVVKVVFRGGQTLCIATLRVLGRCSSARIQYASGFTYVPKMFLKINQEFCHIFNENYSVLPLSVEIIYTSNCSNSHERNFHLLKYYI